LLKAQRALTSIRAVWIVGFAKKYVIARFVLFVCGTLLIFASVARAGGRYQPTEDGKTIVWNSNPKPGDAAAWWGDRDRERYATGFGTLTWFRAKGKVYARYYGNMVRGKFDGPVNVHSHGKTAHAYFVNGGRSTPWARGPAPSRPEVRVDRQLTKTAEGLTSASGPASSSEELPARREASASEERPAETQAPPETESEEAKPKTSKGSAPASAKVHPTHRVARKSKSDHGSQRPGAGNPTPSAKEEKPASQKADDSLKSFFVPRSLRSGPGDNTPAETPSPSPSPE
jgi:hypothetical protein